MNIGRCFNEAIEVYKRNFVQLVVAAFLFELLTLVSLTLLAGPLAGGFALMTLNAIRRDDKYADLGDLFRGFRRFFSLVGLFYLTLIPIMFGLLLLLVPGILLMSIWIFCSFLVIDRDLGVVDSIGTSTQMVQRSGLGNYFLLVIIILALSMAPSAIPFLGILLGWFLMPLAWLLEASAYSQEVDAEEYAVPTAHYGAGHVQPPGAVPRG